MKLTAAGQLRIYTGFPINLLRCIKCSKTYSNAKVVKIGDALTRFSQRHREDRLRLYGGSTFRQLNDY